jgi:hypothetical protein
MDDLAGRRQRRDRGERHVLRVSDDGDSEATCAHYCTLSNVTGVLSMKSGGRGRWLHGLIDDRRVRSPFNGPHETCGVDEAGRSGPATGCRAPGVQARERRIMSDRQDLPAAETIHQMRGGR